MINILSIGFQIPGLPKTSRYVILGSLFLRIGEYLFRLIELATIKIRYLDLCIIFAQSTQISIIGRRIIYRVLTLTITFLLRRTICHIATIKNTASPKAEMPYSTLYMFSWNRDFPEKYF